MQKFFHGRFSVYIFMQIKQSFNEPPPIQTLLENVHCFCLWLKTVQRCTPTVLCCRTCSNGCAKERRKRRQVHCNKQPPQSHFCPAGIVHTVRIDTELCFLILFTQTIIRLCTECLFCFLIQMNK